MGFLKKTYYIIISPNSNLPPNALFYNLMQLGLQITIKETCSGVLIEGEEKEVEKAITKAKKLDPDKIFIKERGYPIWDQRICRMKIKGGPRPGFLQLEAEYKLLPLISEAIKKVKPEIKSREKKKKAKIEEIKSIINERY